MRVLCLWSLQMVQIAAVTVIACANPLFEHLAVCDTKPTHLQSIPSDQQTFNIWMKHDSLYLSANSAYEHLCHLLLKL